MKLFIYAYDQLYGGLHGMYNYAFCEFDNEKRATEWAIELSCDVIHNYYDIEDSLAEDVDSVCDDRESEEWETAYDEAVMEDTAYEIYALKDEVKKKTDEELEELIFEEGVEEFIEKYCHEPKWE